VEERAKVDVGISHLDSQHDYYDAIVLSNVLNSKNVILRFLKIWGKGVKIQILAYFHFSTPFISLNQG
jgi:hypothetical protein